MKYSLAECQKIYKFFEKDFFQRELGVKLGPCLIFIDPDEAREALPGVDDWDHLSGLSFYNDGRNYIYLDKILLDSKKLMANTILHEMIHLYDQHYNPYVRNYRGGHGALWTKTAKRATEIYGSKIGAIDRYADEHEVERKSHYRMIHSTKTLANAYVVVLRSRELVPVKTLSQEEIEILKKTNIRGIFRVKPNLQQSEANRVKCYATFEQLMDDINLGVTEEEEERYAKLSLKLGTDSERIWLNPNNSQL
jgi:hypothetical protein